MRGTLAALVVLVSTLCLAASAGAAPLNAYRVDAGPRQLETLRQQGFDVTEGRRAGSIEIVGTSRQIAALRRKGVKARLLHDRRGRTALRATAAQAADGWQVWRPYARTTCPCPTRPALRRPT